MKNENILEVIDTLGEMIVNYKTTIAVNEYEIKKLKQKLEAVEQYIEFYTEQNLSELDYKETIK